MTFIYYKAPLIHPFMVRIRFYPAVASLCVLSLASACHSNSDTAADKAITPAAEAAAPTAQVYPVLALAPQNTQLHVDYPAVLKADPRTGKAQAYFLVKEKAVLEYEWNRQDSTMQEVLWQMSNVQLVLPSGTVYDQRGRVDRTKEQAAPAGSVALKVTFPNPLGELHTGAKGIVRLPLPMSNALLIPQSATYEVQGKRWVYVVGPSNKVVSTEIKVVPFAADSGYVVHQGLKAGDQVVTQGVESLQDGQLIVPRPLAVSASASLF